MKEKKTIGFDILDNVGLDTIDRIGTDMDMLDEKTKKRILEMTKKRFNDAIKGENAGIENIVTDENAEIVENVEVYNRSKIRRIMTGVVNTAAVVGLAAGSVFLVKSLGRGDIDKPVEPDMPAVSSTEPANQTQEEKARNQRIEEYIQNLYNSTGDQYSDEDFYNNLKIDYAYLDINNDSVSELLIRYDFIDSAADAKGMSINYFDGTNYVHFYDVWGTFKFDLNNRKLYELSKTYLNENVLDISTWENIEISDNTVFFTSQDKYRPIDSDDVHYSHNEEPCTKEEYDKAMAEYENCVGAELNFMPYTVKRESAEKTARNQRIEEYIQELYNRYGMPDEEQFYECLDIKYAYLDINNDSVSELLVYYDFVQAAAYAKGIGLNYFDGTKYVHFNEVWDTDKFDLNNRRLYDLSESHLGEQRLEINTWENVEFSGNEPFFTFYESYYTEFGATVDDVTYYYNNAPCTKEKFESGLAEYENCDSAELNFIPYNVKKLNGQSAEESARNQEIEVSYEPEGQVIEQSIEAGEKSDGEVPITFDLPAEANGRFVIAFMVQKEDGTPEIQESATFYCPEYRQLTQNIIGSGKNVNVTAIITNLSNNKRATIGTYIFNFAEGRYTCLSGGDPYTAFEAIGAFPEPETESPPLPKYGDEEPPVEDSTTTTE
ncbi:MAG: hypothetical protein IJB68_08120 [Ruminococcus sp.]|nr:hypothetical protein [Ruminococcus sp.]